MSLTVFGTICIDTIETPGGVTLRPRFQAGDEHGYVMGGPGDVLARGVNEPDRLLPPGRYRVTVSVDGHPPRTEVAEIVPGEVVELRFSFAR